MIKLTFLISKIDAGNQQEVAVLISRKRLAEAYGDETTGRLRRLGNHMVAYLAIAWLAEAAERSRRRRNDGEAKRISCCYGRGQVLSVWAFFWCLGFS